MAIDLRTLRPAVDPRVRRQQTGDGAATAPALQPASTSEGDRNRNSLGPSRYERRFVRYVADDDGYPITYATDQLLALILEELQKQTMLLERLEWPNR